MTRQDLSDYLYDNQNVAVQILQNFARCVLARQRLLSVGRGVFRRYRTLCLSILYRFFQALFVVQMS